MTILHLEASLLDLAVVIDVEGLDEELRHFVLKVVEINVRQQPARSKACGSRSAQSCGDHSGAGVGPWWRKRPVVQGHGEGHRLYVLTGEGRWLCS